MKCSRCGELLRLSFKAVIVDTLVKDYFCKNGHKAIIRRYGTIVEINGRKMNINEQFDVTEANRSEARKRVLRDLLQKTSPNKAI